MPDDDDPEGIIAQYRDRVCAGSHLVLSQFASDSDPDATGELRAVAAGIPVETYFRPRPRIRRFFGGFELLPPGLTDVQAWRQDATAPTRLRIAGAVGRKP